MVAARHEGVDLASRPNQVENFLPQAMFYEGMSSALRALINTPRYVLGPGLRIESDARSTHETAPLPMLENNLRGLA